MDKLFTVTNNLKTETLLKIAERFNIPGNLFRQKTWNGCVFNQITGEHSVTDCAPYLKEQIKDVRDFISVWDSMGYLGNEHSNKELRDCVMQVLASRGFLVDIPEIEVPVKPRVKSVTKIAKFKSTMIEDIPLVSTEEIDTFLKEVLFANV